MDRLKAMITFVRIVDAGSLSAAAEAVGQSAASVVRTLAALEAHLGARLLNRNTRRLALTQEGAEFLEWSRRILSEFDDIERRFDARNESRGGLLRVSAPVEFGRRYVAPIVHAFLSLHPAVRVEFMLADRIVDLIDEGLDLAIRIGQLPASTLVARPLGRTRLVVCASPDYLRQFGDVRHPSDLGRHACVAFAPQGRDWHFQHQGVALTQAISARITTDQAEVARVACLEGLGITRLLHYQVAEELSAGRLLRLLQPFEPVDIPVQIVYPHSKLLASRVREFIDWTCTRLRRQIPDPDLLHGVP